MAPLESKSLYMATFDGVIDFSFVIMPLIVGAVASWRVQLPFLVCALLLLTSAAVFSLQRVRKAPSTNVH
jgi:hypothetical protein